MVTTRSAWRLWSKPPQARHLVVQHALAGVAEGRVAEVVGERDGFGEILVEPQRAGDRAGHLADFERVGQPGAEMLAVVAEEDLGLVLEAAERGGMDDAVAVALELRARRAGAGRQTARPRERDGSDA